MVFGDLLIDLDCLHVYFRNPKSDPGFDQRPERYCLFCMGEYILRDGDGDGILADLRIAVRDEGRWQLAMVDFVLQIAGLALDSGDSW